MENIKKSTKNVHFYNRKNNCVLHGRFRKVTYMYFLHFGQSRITVLIVIRISGIILNVNS